MKHYLYSLLVEILNQFGYNTSHEFKQSLFPISLPVLAFNLSVSGVFACVTAWIEKYIGLPFPLFIIFILLIIAEYISGIYASHKEGKDFQSRIAGRIVIKIVVYIFIFAVINIFKMFPISANDGFHKLFIDLNVYEWLYLVAFYFISFQLIRSLFENMYRIEGYKESGLLSLILRSRIIRIFGILARQPYDLEAKSRRDAKQDDVIESENDGETLKETDKSDLEALKKILDK